MRKVIVFILSLFFYSAFSQSTNQFHSYAFNASKKINTSQTNSFILKTHFASIGDTTVPEKRNLKERLDKFNEFMQWYLKYFPFPYASFSNETNILVGISKFNAFTLGKHHVIDSITQPSSASAFGYFTLNNQYKCVLETNLMFHKNKSQLKVTLGYTDYPMNFYGIGNYTSLDSQTTIVTTNYQINTYYLVKTYKKIYIGPSLDYYDFQKVQISGTPEEVERFKDETISGLGRQTGIGLKLLMEGRDNRLNAKHGLFTDMSYQLYRKKYGSDFNYDFFMADIRYYTPVYKRVVLAMQAHLESKVGDVPVQSLSMLGGDYTMRGTYRGRYRDNVSLDSQTEFRFPIYWIIGGVIFTGVGQVAPTYEQLSVRNTHFTYGAGLRLQMDSAHDVNLRFDYGRSNDESMFIVNISEAF